MALYLCHFFPRFRLAELPRNLADAIGTGKGKNSSQGNWIRRLVCKHTILVLERAGFLIDLG